MYQIQTMNRISPAGLARLDAAQFSIADACARPDGILVRSASLHDMPLPESLLAVARAGAGVNNIPVDACSAAGVVVFNTPGANANAVKELVLAGLVLAGRKVVQGAVWAKTLAGQPGLAKRVEQGKGDFAGPELAGKTLGVVGLGAIGARVANMAVHLGMDVLGYDPYISVDGAWSLSRSVRHCLDLRELLGQCDYLTLHLPVTPDTKNLLNGKTLAACKPGVRVLNFARAELVDSAALLAALDAGQAAAYVTDFAADALLAHPQCVCLPHLGASTPESEENCAVMAAGQLRDYLCSGNIVNSVNFPNLSMPRTGGARVCVIHKNVPGMLAVITDAAGKAKVNIENLTNKSKGAYAYTMLDAAGPVDETVAAAIRALPDMIRVRLLP